MDSLANILTLYLAGLPPSTTVRGEGEMVVVEVRRANVSPARYRFTLSEDVASKLREAVRANKAAFAIQVANTIESAIAVRVLPDLAEEVRLFIGIAAPGVLVATEG